MLNSPAYMHIPDGYLSPVTSVIFFILILPFWYLGVRKLRERMNSRYVPVIALMAAFSFIIMMFNVPLPGAPPGMPWLARWWRLCWGRKSLRLPSPLRWSSRLSSSATVASWRSAPTASTWPWCCPT